MTDRYCVVDVETNGLDAHENALLEIAAVIVDAKTLDVVSETPFHAVVRYSAEEVGILAENAVPFVREMHATSGLWSRILAGVDTLPISAIDITMTEWLSLYGQPRKMPVMGNSVRLDMNFIDATLPSVSGYLDYHMRDVSTVSGLANDWYDAPWFEKSGTHEALTDVLECIEELKHFRKHAFRTEDEHYVFQQGAEWHRDLIVAEGRIADALAACQKALEVKVQGSSEGDAAMAAMASVVKRALKGEAP